MATETNRMRKLPRPVPLLCAVMSWLVFWSLPVPVADAPQAVMLTQTGILFASGVAASGLAGTVARIPGIVLIGITAFIGTACLNNGEAAYGSYALLASAALAAGAFLVRFSMPFLAGPAVASPGA